MLVLQCSAAVELIFLILQFVVKHYFCYMYITVYHKLNEAIIQVSYFYEAEYCKKLKMELKACFQAFCFIESYLRHQNSSSQTIDCGAVTLLCITYILFLHILAIDCLSMLCRECIYSAFWPFPLL